MITTNQRIIWRKWESLRKNREHMEKLVLDLMANPATEPVHLARAHEMYADMCKRLADISHHVSNVLRTGSTTGLEIEDTECSCGFVGKRIKGQAYRCPECGMY